MNNHFYTYAYLREDKTPYYIGKGKGDRVYKKSKNDIKPPRDKSRIILLKQNLSEKDAFNHEKYMIAIFGRKDLGTGILHNRTDGGDGSSGVLQTEETKLKRSNALKGRPRPEEVKNKIGEKNKGRTQSQEARNKIGDTHKGNTYWAGRKHTEESKQKMRDAKVGKSSHMKGKSHSEETKDKISASKKGKSNGCEGRKYSPETIEKMRQSAKNRKNKNSKHS
jgi:hypothetical protein